VRLFTRNRESEVRGFVLKVVNNNCPELKSLLEGPRADSRVNLTVVVLVVPVHRKKLMLEQSFFAVTKEFSGSGVGLVVERPRPIEEAVLGFRWEGDTVFLRAWSKHLHPLGGGFFQIGMELTEVVPVGDYPELASLSF
jgi:hypothetical protein